MSAQLSAVSIIEQQVFMLISTVSLKLSVFVIAEESLVFCLSLMIRLEILKLI